MQLEASIHDILLGRLLRRHPQAKAKVRSPLRNRFFSASLSLAGGDVPRTHTSTSTHTQEDQYSEVQNTHIFPPREQLCNWYCSNKHTLGTVVINTHTNTGTPPEQLCNR
jgi:hypothetical protein